MALGLPGLTSPGNQRLLSQDLMAVFPMMAILTGGLHIPVRPQSWGASPGLPQLTSLYLYDFGAQGKASPRFPPEQPSRGEEQGVVFA